MSSDTKKILIAVPILLLALYFAYTTFFATPAEAPDSMAVDGGSSEILGQDILIMVERLPGISIDKSVFSGVALTHLQDFSSTITPEAQGKSNPFVPVIVPKK